MTKYGVPAYARLDSESQRTKDKWAKEEKAARNGVVRKLRPLVWAKTGGKCWFCGIQTSVTVGGQEDDHFTVDHFIAFMMDGSDELGNLVPCCRKCNVTRGARSTEHLRRTLSGMPRFTSDQLAYLAHIGVELPDPDYVFYFEQEGL